MSRTFHVPCNGCRACCYDAVWLLPKLGDDVDSYDHVMVNGAPTLRRNDDVSCVYLGAHGCSIHERAPALCKHFDCRKFYSALTPEQRQRALKRKENVAIFAAARKLLGIET